MDSTAAEITRDSLFSLSMEIASVVGGRFDRRRMGKCWPLPSDGCLTDLATMSNGDSRRDSPFGQVYRRLRRSQTHTFDETDGLYLFIFFAFREKERTCKSKCCIAICQLSNDDDIAHCWRSHGRVWFHLVNAFLSFFRFVAFYLSLSLSLSLSWDSDYFSLEKITSEMLSRGGESGETFHRPTDVCAFSVQVYIL